MKYLLILLAAALVLAGCGDANGYGKELQLLSVEHKGFPRKWHWKDVDTGACYYSTSETATTLWEEPCR